jgi:hypothetical protein
VDDAGDVVTGVTVMPMRFRTVNGERQLQPTGQPRTSDDTGTFRLFGLPPGKYYLSARAEEAQRFGGELEPDATGFAPTFYPGTPTAAEAQPIEVVAGSEIVADLPLVTARLATIRGIVVDAAGRPATGGHVMLSGSSGAGAFMWGGGGGSIEGNGTFTLSGIAPGEYTVVAQASFGAADMFDSINSESLRSAFASVVAGGEPIDGLRLVVQQPIRIPVNVTFEDASTDKPERVFVSANTQRGVGSSMAAIRDGRLSLEVVPGTYRLSAGSMSAQPWFVKRLTYRGRDIEDDDVELTAEPGGRIDITFTSRSSTVTGGVTDDGGKPVADYTVFIVPEDVEALHRYALRRMRVVTPDAQGRFRVEHLQPGRYVATAIAEGPVEDISDPDFLDAIRRAGTRITVADGGAATAALTLRSLP